MRETIRIAIEARAWTPSLYSLLQSPGRGYIGEGSRATSMGGNIHKLARSYIVTRTVVLERLYGEMYQPWARRSKLALLCTRQRHRELSSWRKRHELSVALRRRGSKTGGSIQMSGKENDNGVERPQSQIVEGLLTARTHKRRVHHGPTDTYSAGLGTCATVCEPEL